MDPDRFRSLAGRYPELTIAVLGDFCLDRYLEIDPRLGERSIETGLPVHNVVAVRSQAGGAGTVLNNLSRLGIGRIVPIGFAGLDGEGWELVRALGALPGVSPEHVFTTPERVTFTYTKPLVLEEGQPPRELERLDLKNWTPTPPAVAGRLRRSLGEVGAALDALVLLEQVERADTGVLSTEVLEEVHALARARPGLLVIADSRRGLASFPPATFKMNLAEFAELRGLPDGAPIETVRAAAATLAAELDRAVFVTMAERGILGAVPGGSVHHAPALPRRGEIDIVGAGDAVTANLAAALAAGAAVAETVEVAMAAASVVVHELGTTGAASVEEIAELLS